MPQADGPCKCANAQWGREAQQYCGADREHGPREPERMGKTQRTHGDLGDHKGAEDRQRRS